jgi:hypothetical protein
MNLMRKYAVIVGWFCLLAGTAEAQQIYRWTDTNGQVHFGNQPPAGAKGIEAKDREKSETTLECEAEVREKCQDYIKKYGKWQHSEAYRDCLERYRETCEQYQAKAKPTQGRERTVSTPTLSFDPGLGDSLLCEMRCRSRCRGQVEIRTDRVIKKGENYGSDHYSVEIKPPQSGSAYCAVSTRNDNVQLALSVVRNGNTVALVEGQ